MQVLEINPVADARWSQIVTRYEGSLFYAPPWLNVIACTYDWHPVARIVLDDDGLPLAGFAYFCIDDFRGERIISLPFSDFADPLVQEPAHWHALIDDLTARQQPIMLRCLHNPLPCTDDRFEAYRQAKWHRLDLRADLEAVWMQISSSARYDIRKAEKAGVTTEVTRDAAMMRHFFKLHLGVRKYKHQLLPQPYRFFETIHDNFFVQENGALIVALHEEQVVGCALFLEWGDTLFYKFSASDLSELSVRPTDSIIWGGIAYAKSRGLSYLDFGLSDWEHKGLQHFKRKYASDEGTISLLRFGTNGEPSPRVKQVNQLFGQLTELLTQGDVPDEVTARAGDHMYRFFT